MNNTTQLNTWLEDCTNDLRERLQHTTANEFTVLLELRPRGYDFKEIANAYTIVIVTIQAKLPLILNQ